MSCINYVPDLGRRGGVGVRELDVSNGLRVPHSVPHRVPTDADIAESVPAIQNTHDRTIYLLTDKARARCEV